jgi:hypothetical protein
VDETDIGNRDPLLKATYKGLPKLRYTSAFESVVCPLVNLLHSFRAACILSWSHKAAHLPSYSGMLEEVPRVNKKYVFVCCIVLVC